MKKILIVEGNLREENQSFSDLKAMMALFGVEVA